VQALAINTGKKEGMKLRWYI